MVKNRHKKINLKNLLLVDFDDTLIDTKSFKSILFSSLSEKSGLTLARLGGIYHSIKQGLLLKEGWPIDFARKISQECAVSENELLGIIYQDIKRIKINKNVIDFVKRFKGVKILLTSGDRDFQNKKLDSLGLRSYFDKVIIISEEKYKYLLSFIGNDVLKLEDKTYNNVLIVDDRSNLLRKLEKFSFIKVMHPDTLKV